MSQNDLLILNGGVVILVIISYALIRRSPQPPVRLRMHENRPEKRTEKSLNIMFLFEGQRFDAFEALEIPAGSSTEAARTAYTLLLKTAGRERHAFLSAAYQAISRDKLT